MRVQSSIKTSADCLSLQRVDSISGTTNYYISVTIIQYLSVHCRLDSLQGKKPMKTGNKDSCRTCFQSSFLTFTIQFLKVNPLGTNVPLLLLRLTWLKHCKRLSAWQLIFPRSINSIHAVNTNMFQFVGPVWRNSCYHNNRAWTA